MSLAREQGTLIYTDLESDKVIAAVETVQCVHCGAHFPKPKPKLTTRTLTRDEAYEFEKQGRKARGWCMNCKGFICGPECAKCVPQEQLLENIEKGQPLDFRPVVSKPLDLSGPNAAPPKLWLPSS